jgi:hypothetical protein
VIPVKVGEAARRAIPHARLEVMKTGQRVPFSFDPGGVLTLVQPFINAARRPVSGTMA